MQTRFAKAGVVAAFLTVACTVYFLFHPTYALRDDLQMVGLSTKLGLVSSSTNDREKPAQGPSEPDLASPTKQHPSTHAFSMQPSGSAQPGPGKDDKIVVIGKLQHEDTEWVAKSLPEWQHAIYTVNNISVPLHTKANKGREANAYLTYIIKNYDTLPSTVAFVHSHLDGYPAAWHTDADEHSNVGSLRALNIDFVQRNGYANLRCIWIPGCPDEVQLFRDPPKEDDDGQSVERATAEVWPLFFNSTSAPPIIATPCCAQFAVSRMQIQERPLSDYERYHQWLMSTELDDAVSGRVFEYLWHIIFGQDPVYCPDLQQCYADVYGGRWGGG